MKDILYKYMEIIYVQCTRTLYIREQLNNIYIQKGNKRHKFLPCRNYKLIQWSSYKEACIEILPATPALQKPVMRLGAPLRLTGCKLSLQC